LIYLTAFLPRPSRLCKAAAPEQENITSPPSQIMGAGPPPPQKKKFESEVQTRIRICAIRIRGPGSLDSDYDLEFLATPDRKNKFRCSALHLDQ
jgi:hypothetical protein